MGYHVGMKELQKGEAERNSEQRRVGEMR